jgi:hypothetical protein
MCFCRSSIPNRTPAFGKNSSAWTPTTPKTSSSPRRTVSTAIPAPLLDRFDVVALTGYNKSAKAAIGQKLVRRLIQKWRIEEDVRTPDLPGVIAVAVEKTHAQEKGVRQLGKALNAVFKAALTEKFKSGLTPPSRSRPTSRGGRCGRAPGNGGGTPLWAIGRVQGLAVMSGRRRRGTGSGNRGGPSVRAPRRISPAGGRGGPRPGLMDFSQQTALPAALGWLERNGGPTVDSFRGKLIALLVLPWHIPKDGDSAGTAFTLAMIVRAHRAPPSPGLCHHRRHQPRGQNPVGRRHCGQGDQSPTSRQNHFLPRENENDLLSHLLKSPDQIHFVEVPPSGGDWERALYVMPRAFTNAGLPASAVDRYVRDAKNAGLRRFTIPP